MRTITQGAATPFRDYAPKYWDLGLPAFPTQPDNPKQPCIASWNKFSKPPSSKTQDLWLNRFSNANLGLPTGQASGVVVVDVDDDYAMPDAMLEFGGSECITQTSRGYHLYYRHNGESTMKGFMNRNLDILSDGAFTVLPQSINPKTGKTYAQVGTDLFYCPSLNTILPEAIPKADSGTFVMPSVVTEGQRDVTLFNALREAYFQGYADFNQLLCYAYELNQQHMHPPLPDKQVIAKVKSIMQYALSGNLVPPKTQYANIWEPQANELPPVAYKLFGILKQEHSGIRAEFWIVQKAMARKIGVTQKTLAKAIQELIKANLIQQTYQGGKGAKDAHRYQFNKGVK